jgi:hypothetical protein
MAAYDAAHDRQSEPTSATCDAAAANERLEYPVDLLLGNSWPGILDPEYGEARGLDEINVNSAIGL